MVLHAREDEQNVRLLGSVLKKQMQFKKKILKQQLQKKLIKFLVNLRFL